MIFESREYDDEAKAALSRTFDDDAYLRDTIANKLCKVYRVTEDNGDLLAWLVCYETRDNFLMVECLEGKGANKIAEHIIQAIESIGMRGVRFYTERKGLPKLMEKNGAKIKAYIVEYETCHQAEVPKAHRTKQKTIAKISG